MTDTSGSFLLVIGFMQVLEMFKNLQSPSLIHDALDGFRGLWLEGFNVTLEVLNDILRYMQVLHLESSGVLRGGLIG
jgi:shikimate 5-dehydrogenase